MRMSNGYSRLILLESVVGLFVILTQVASAQERPLPITDGSPRTSPVSCRGTATLGTISPKQYDLHLVARNVSQKTILLRILRVDIVVHPGSDEEDTRTMRRVDDFYFGSNAWEPRAAEALELHNPNTFVKPASLITVTTTFVQFADGSTWGDDADGKRLITERQGDLEKLVKLAQLHDSAGKEEFASALMKEQAGEFPVIENLKHTYKETGDTEAVMREINLMLQHAKSRAQEMAHNPSS